MNQLDWLRNYRLVSVARRDYDWVFTFDEGVSLVVACLWRLVENNHIRLTNHDDGQQFGLPTHVDAEHEISACLTLAIVSEVKLREGTLDLCLSFATGHVVEIIPSYSGYEAWTIESLDHTYIAVGGGNLSIVESRRDNSA